MKTNWICGAWLGLAMILDAGTALAAGEEVIVYVREDNVRVADLSRAEGIAARLFASIGVPMTFRSGAEKKPASPSVVTIEVQIHAKAPASLRSGAMAHAAPYSASGTRIHIFCDRVRTTLSDGGSGMALGYVLAHELGHVLQGVGRHSEAGVMKARWESADYRLMRSGTLEFDPSDGELIHAGLAKIPTLMASAGQPVR
jgi:hypothetical protein